MKADEKEMRTEKRSQVDEKEKRRGREAPSSGNATDFRLEAQQAGRER